MDYLYVIGKHKEAGQGKGFEFDVTYMLSQERMPQSIRRDFEEKGELVLQEIKLPKTMESGKTLEVKVTLAFSDDPYENGGC